MNIVQENWEDEKKSEAESERDWEEKENDGEEANLSQVELEMSEVEAEEHKFGQFEEGMDDVGGEVCEIHYVPLNTRKN